MRAMESEDVEALASPAKNGEAAARHPLSFHSMEQKSGVDAFIERWRGVTGSERANYQLFITGLCELLDLPTPEPAREDTRDNAYVFERRVKFSHGDGSTSNGFIDCYRRGHFVLEAKKVKAGVHTQGFDDALMRARAQAEGYARALPASECRPPFLVVVDVGHVIELYAEFTRSGATYTPFPDARSHRIRLDDLHKSEVVARLKALWTDPMALDPARISAKVTREVAIELAKVARSLEGAGHPPHQVAAFLTRCLFSMFAEDVELLPRAATGDGAFVDLLKRYGDQPSTLQNMLRALWTDMDHGGFSAALSKDVLRFNGKLFKSPSSDGYVLPLNREQIDCLLAAASANWREVEPAIFGTLLERALDPAERHALGAHYTPRAYVERLVLPTVVEPLRADWANAQAAALLLATEANTLDGRRREAKMAEARAEVRRFHHQLCTTRVLDPACGSGNFLYVTLEHLKRLEGEVLGQLEELGETQSRLGLQGETVTLQQLLGIELNERAAALAELVLWIGFLQWHIRTFGNASVAEPVVHDYGNIEHRDAVLAFDRAEPVLDAQGQAITRWDGESLKQHPVTGEDVPDEAARVVQWAYVNPRPAEWPAADFIVGNPPFIGASAMRAALGDGYTQTLRATWPAVPESADFVMYWWHHAAEQVRGGQAERFGFITTNSLRQTFNRRVVRLATDDGRLSLVYAVPDHPWVDSANGAAVRIAMTVAARGQHEGRLCTVQTETEGEQGEVTVTLAERRGLIHPDLRIGANVAAARALRANAGLSNTGVKLHGAGFIVTRTEAAALGLGTVDGLERHIREYRNGRDLTATSRDVLVIDLAGLTADAVRQRFPAVYQWVLERVKPERDLNREPYRRTNWWLFGRKNTELRSGLKGLRRYIATIETSKHRTFQLLDASILPDNMLIAIASADALHLGVLSSAVHVHWALVAGGRLGVGNDPRYNKSRCFETFPFPDLDPAGALAQRIRTLAEQIDVHRKSRLAAHPDATLTATYNVLEKLRNGSPLTERERVVHEHGLVSVLKSLHDELDAAVLEAYGWADLTLPADTDTLLVRLVEINAKRAAEEAAGTVRWLRPDFQQRATPGEQTEMDVESEASGESVTESIATTAAASKRPWPSGLPEQIKAVAELLSTNPAPLTLATLEAHFTARGRWRERLPIILETLEALGRTRRLQTSPEQWKAA